MQCLHIPADLRKAVSLSYPLFFPSAMAGWCFAMVSSAARAAAPMLFKWRVGNVRLMFWPAKGSAMWTRTLDKGLVAKEQLWRGNRDTFWVLCSPSPSLRHYLPPSPLSLTVGGGPLSLWLCCHCRHSDLLIPGQWRSKGPHCLSQPAAHLSSLTASLCLEVQVLQASSPIGHHSVHQGQVIPAVNQRKLLWFKSSGICFHV